MGLPLLGCFVKKMGLHRGLVPPKRFAALYRVFSENCDVILDDVGSLPYRYGKQRSTAENRLFLCN